MKILIKKIILASMAVILTFAMNAQETEEKGDFKANGKGIIRIFSNWHTGMGNYSEDSGFELNRAYLGYQYNFAPAWSARVVFDVRYNGVNFQAFAKNAFLAYKDNGLSANFGMIGTRLFKTQEDAWGYRYLYKSAMDEYRFMSSADLGFIAAYKISDMFSADISVLNGEGFRREQDDLGKYRLGVGLTLKPLKGLLLRAYFDYYYADIEAGHDLTTIAFFAGYRIKKFNIGLETDIQTNTAFIDSNDRTIFSTFATYVLNEKIKTFARYDMLKNKADNTLDEDVFIAGFEWQPTKNVKLAPNYRYIEFNDGSAGANYFYMNVGVKF